MKVVIQRVTEASVEVDGATTGAIEAGLVVLVGIEARDTMDDVKWLANKVWSMRLWSSTDDKSWSESAASLKYGILVVSQFTLHARFKGNKPDFHLALEPAKAEVLYNLFVAEMSRLVPAGGQPVASGKFGANMAVKLVNDGPVTMQLDSQTVAFPRTVPRPAPVTGGAKADGNPQEVDVPWVAPTGDESVKTMGALEVDSDGMIAPPDGVLPPGTPMTTLMFKLPEASEPGKDAEVPLPSGMSVKVKVPDGKTGGDLLQIQVPEALMDPEFRAKQEAQRRMQENTVILDFKVPDDKKAGDECPVRLQSGVTLKVTVPEGKVAGDIIKVRVPRNLWDQPPQQRISFTVPEGKGPGDTCEIVLASGRTIKVTVPEGKAAGDVLQVGIPAALNRVEVPPGTPTEKIKWKIPEGKGPGDPVEIKLPSGMAVRVKIPDDKNAGDVLEIDVPRPFLDPKFRSKQAARMKLEEQQQKKLASITEGAGAEGGDGGASKNSNTKGSSNNNGSNNKGKKKKKNKKK